MSSRDGGEHGRRRMERVESGRAKDWTLNKCRAEKGLLLGLCREQFQESRKFWAQREIHQRHFLWPADLAEQRQHWPRDAARLSHTTPLSLLPHVPMLMYLDTSSSWQLF